MSKDNSVGARQTNITATQHNKSVYPRSYWSFRLVADHQAAVKYPLIGYRHSHSSFVVFFCHF